MTTRQRVVVRLPEIFRPLFWSQNFDSLDPEKHRKTIVVQAINYGNLEHWRWLVRYYGKEAVRNILFAIPGTELRPQVRVLVSLLFSIPHFNNAPRGTH